MRRSAALYGPPAPPVSLCNSPMSTGIKIIVDNRRARYEYHLDDRYEAGIELLGSEVKSLRAGKANLQDAFAAIERGEVVLHNLHISPYSHGGYANHEPVRPRKLLLKRAEIGKLQKATEQKGFTLVPTKIYFKNGWAKVEIAVGRGKKLYDKRQDIAEREAKRRMERLR
jgi:SsrA-binding protein